MKRYKTTAVKRNKSIAMRYRMPQEVATGRYKVKEVAGGFDLIHGDDVSVFKNDAFGNAVNLYMGVAGMFYTVEVCRDKVKVRYV